MATTGSRGAHYEPDLASTDLVGPCDLDSIDLGPVILPSIDLGPELLLGPSRLLLNPLDDVARLRDERGVMVPVEEARELI